MNALYGSSLKNLGQRTYEASAKKGISELFEKK